ncbi:hypothetical protein HC031_26050 [Planosporangium thailandense]|uniref:TPM domain-containing protein n=1 Tax=Planosporangium thailandense TaxID=765197 RepID=A0ABX0Y429_9ACTN|nr:hypothetical protein [Planosporangium thailandense]NJC73155.1 hypothetical protein [Planosporangium thailandense]
MIMLTAQTRRRRRFGAVVVTVATALASVLLTAAPAGAATVAIHDDSQVLDATRVQNEAASLPDPVAVYTTTKFADDKAAFDREAQSKVTIPTAIVIAVNTQSQHLAIRTGPRSRVSQSEAQQATQSFATSYRANHDYTAATVAALDSMRTAVRNGPAAGARPPAHRTARSSGGGLVGGLFCLLLVVAVVVAIVGITRRSRRARRS